MIYFTLHSHALIFITFAKYDFPGFFILVVCLCFLLYTYFVLIFMSKLSRCSICCEFHNFFDLPVLPTWPSGRSSHSRCSIKKGVLKNFAKFTGKHLCQSLFFNKFAGLRPATFFKKGSGTGIFL